MGQYFCIRMLCLCFFDLFHLHLLMDRAIAFVVYKVLLRYLLCHKMRQVSVRNEENILVRKFFYDLHCIGRCHTYIGMCLQFCSRIDVTHHCQIFICITHLLDRICICHMRHCTVCMHIRHQYGFLRVQYLRTLSHKRNATEYDSLLFQSNCNLTQIKRISDVVRNFLNLRSYIIMCQNNCIFFLLQFLDFFHNCHLVFPHLS